MTVSCSQMGGLKIVMESNLSKLIYKLNTIKKIPTLFFDKVERLILKLVARIKSQVDFWKGEQIRGNSFANMKTYCGHGDKRSTGTGIMNYNNGTKWKV